MAKSISSDGIQSYAAKSYDGLTADDITRSSSMTVAGNTRIAHDALVMQQLKAGVIPEHFIRRSDNTDFIEIDVSVYSMGDEQGKCLGEALLGLNILRRLNLMDNRLRSSVPTIVKNLTCTCLISLDLSMNNLHGAGATAIAHYFQQTNVMQTLR
jgi:hypothetical protein